MMNITKTRGIRLENIKNSSPSTEAINALGWEVWFLPLVDHSLENDY